MRQSSGFRKVLIGGFIVLMLGASLVLYEWQGTRKIAVAGDTRQEPPKESAAATPAPSESSSQAPPASGSQAVNPSASQEAPKAQEQSATQATEPGPAPKGQAHPAKPALLLQLKPPYSSSEEFVKYMKERRNEDQGYLEQRYQRAMIMIENQDLYRERELAAFLNTPREKFCRKWNLKRAYDHAFLDIGYGVTISGPHLVGRMTSALDVQPGEKVLEIGTGSGYQSAVLSNLTDKVYTIEIIEPLAESTDKLYGELVQAGYKEYENVKRKADDGYYGWEEYAPFDKIIVTCGIDHIPPPLLKQLKVGGAMVIPVGPPGAQIVLKVTKNQDEQGNFTITREDIYFGKKKVPFVPFTKKGGGTHFK